MLNQRNIFSDKLARRPHIRVSLVTANRDAPLKLATSRRYQNQHVIIS